MKRSSRFARTRLASGRSLLALTALAALAGCQLAAVETVAPPAAGPAGPVLASGPITAADQREAERLYGEAEASFQARRYFETLRLTEEVMRRFPASTVSGDALLLTARAELGSGAPERADAAAERYIGLLDPADPRVGATRLLQAEALADRPRDQLDRLLRIPATAPPSQGDRARTLARAAADSLSFEELDALVGRLPSNGAAAPPVLARVSAKALAAGRAERASELATVAVAAGAVGEDLVLAEGVLRGELPESMRPTRTFTIATVLPVGGPPALAEFSALVAEGVEVAVATVLGDEFDVSIVERDDQADPALAARIAGELEAEGVVGAVGFLLDETLVAARAATPGGVPFVSPTARSATLAGDGAYSLEGADRQAAEAVAHHAVSRGFQRVAMIYPDTPEAADEGDAFAAVANAFGIPIVGRFTYEAGATDFEAQFRLAQDSLRAAEIAALGLTEEDTLVAVADLLEPAGLFMPIPAEDVEFVAPQFAHFGLDTLAIEVVGTSGWTDPQALEQVDPRLVTGVVATAPVSAGPGAPGYARFRQAYEAYFQRSLVSPTPAIGYDATYLLLEALRSGRTGPAEVRASFAGLTEVEGATGWLSIVDGRVLRRTQLVRIEGAELIPIPPG